MVVFVRNDLNPFKACLLEALSVCGKSFTEATMLLMEA